MKKQVSRGDDQPKQPASQKGCSPVPDNKRRTRDRGSGESRLDDSIAINTTTSVLI